MRALEVAFTLFLSTLPAGAMAGDAAGPSPEKAVALDNLVRQDCGSCHGLTLKGGLGRPITPSALEGFDVVSLRNIVLHGIPGTPMPPWSGILTPEEAHWIAAGLKEGRFQ